MLSASDRQDRVPVSELFAAIGRKAWDVVEQYTSPSIALEIHAAPAVRSRRNEHLWRSVSLQGRDALRDYLLAVHEAMPGLTLEPRDAAFPLTDPIMVRTECAGVDNAGSPFDAEAEFKIWATDGILQRVEARVNAVTVGSEVIRHTDGDPRRYFRYFLDQAGTPA
ncbi:MAG: hypothetical protein NVSMB17_12790 [Candidatus Dormibacteria bacterium]